MKTPTISSCLWFDGKAEEAVRFYLSVFPQSVAGSKMRMEDYDSGREGNVVTSTFCVGDLEFVCLNGGPQFKFNESVSFVINCDTQEEVDYYWDKLSGDGGEESMCGWLKDRYGLSWQVTPRILIKLMQSPDRAVAKRVGDAMMKMRKIDIAKIEAAAAKGD